METDSRTRVLIADGQPLVRKAIGAALDGEVDLTVVAEAFDGLQVVPESLRSHPDVIVLNADLPSCDGIEVTRRLLEESPDCRVIVIGDRDHENTIERAVEAGACGYLSQLCSLSDLIEATRAASRGESTVPRALLGGLLTRLLDVRRERDEAVEKLKLLSRQEHTVLELLAQGHSNNGIAEALTISPATARTHVQRILAKLGVHSRLEAAAYARQGAIA